MNVFISSKIAPTFGLIGTSFAFSAGSLVGGAGEGVGDVAGGHRLVGLVNCWYFALAIFCNSSAYCTITKGRG